ncbi:MULTISPECIES: amino acid ABC transporter substrate-binding protein [Variovorax]|uniref:Amino acid ABC transporter substrate-binding protein n=1 Tax=Variovorax ginsengisoli TaxID=363844 RepID=A0ABT8SD13_9BURK|nr:MULTISPECIES: amino acid ABC transporter substrate-binding protein [Variovorax]MDM0042344.1 amino acid ABC transporter substrate-binding protein [Variovorax sp. J22R193]MDM0054598.1 amino acid ABC transporter substrate-binding protein [Variovorax sp. J22G47]MDM0060949.1 amino acid ABC transporter substrate-binding protein [Variovorax sp. J22G21]MDM0122143.1 amino acid ABC transporter substrate-binding protein [Variovorax sp. J2L1-78]MDM0131328.1 amino acid ABC transporter substrate-binding 
MSTNGHRPRNIFNAVACAATLVASVAIAQPRPASAPVAAAAPSVASPTLNAIKARGQLICGVGGDRPGFGFPDARGVMRGFDADVCRSIAAAIFGNPDKVRFVSLTSLTRFPSLQSGEVDIVARFTTWTLTREAQLGLEVPAIHFYDGQGFLVKKKDGIKSAHDLGGASVCFQPGSTGEVNAADFFRANKLEMKPVVIEKMEQMRDAIVSGRCDAYTNDTAQLASFKASIGSAGNDYQVLPEIISKEPLGAFIRKGDQRFFDIVRWTHAAMLNAEEFGMTAANIDKFRNNSNPAIQRFMGETGDLGAALGLDAQWAVNVVKGVGNYAEIYERSIAPLGLPRGLNRLLKDGGIQYAAPMR